MKYTKDGKVILNDNPTACCNKCMYLNFRTAHCRRNRKILINTYASAGGYKVFFQPQECPGQLLREEFVKQVQEARQNETD